MASKKLGDIKGPSLVWIFVLSYLTILAMLGESSKVTLPQALTVSIVFRLLIAMAQPFGVILAFLVIFLAFYEKRHSLIEIFSSVGLRRKGIRKSILWTFALIPLIFVVYLFLMMITHFLGPISFPQASGSNNGQTPLWYLYYMILYSLFPVALVEETFARGYLLDRLMPRHPSRLLKALPAILLSSLLFTLYHLPTYLKVYQFSTAWAIALLTGNVFPWSIILSIAYVKAGTRNIIGPVVMHFLADSMPIVLKLAYG